MPLNLPAAAQPYAGTIAAAAQQYGIDPGLLASVIQTESSWNPTAVSHDANGNPIAYGIAQFTPDTAQAYGVNFNSPVSSIYGAARLLSDNLAHFGGDTSKAIAAYNAGIGAVDKNGLAATEPNYVDNVLKNYQQITGQAADVKRDITGAPIGSDMFAGKKITDLIPGAKSLFDTKGLTDYIDGLAYKSGIFAVGGALVAGGFVWLASTNKDVREAVKIAAEGGA